MSDRNRIKYEVCVDTAVGAVAAKSGGADRVEFCANLLEGGTTPSTGAVQFARERLDIGIMVLVRPRGGDFVYPDDEVEVMRQIGVDGVVVGALQLEGT